MLLARDRNHGDYEINSYLPGKIVVNDHAYSESVLVSMHHFETWVPNNIDELQPTDFEKILAWQPDVILLGTGDILSFPDKSILKAAIDAQIGVEVMSTLAACRTFHVLMAENRNAVAALLIR